MATTLQARRQLTGWATARIAASTLPNRAYSVELSQDRSHGADRDYPVSVCPVVTATERFGNRFQHRSQTAASISGVGEGKSLLGYS